MLSAMEYQPTGEAFRDDLLSGETVLWSAQPDRKIVFHSQDRYLIPFSFLWGGFAIFWEASVTGFGGTFHRNVSDPTNWFFVLWGVPFVVTGQYMVWGRFIYDWWKKQKTFYAITNKRILILTTVRGRNLVSLQLSSADMIDKTERPDGKGTLLFGMPIISYKSRQSFSFDGSDGRPSFRDIPDVRQTYNLITGLQQQLAKTGKS